ncbi:MAG: hypothetical protein IPK60_02475 [Sandaracinaceae bacterium]|nr:hypothetical protein [Sandaracinaceae bacterium]
MFSLSCNPGAGAGEAHGTLTATDCGLEDAPFALAPDFFTAEAVRDELHMRLQEGSDLQIRSDGLTLVVTDAARVRSTQLETPLLVGEGEGVDVRMSLYLNSRCHKDRHETPVIMSASEGSIVFHDIYAPLVDDRALRIAADFDNVQFSDPYDPEARHAVLSGSFEVIYNRGRPSQRFP